jgi:hypothetical protein
MCKNKIFFHFFFTKNKPLEKTNCEAGLPDATLTEVSSQNTNEGSGSKAEKRKFQDVWKSEFLWFMTIFTITVVTLCIVMFAERQDQILLTIPNLLLERKSINVKVLFIVIKVRNMKNVSIWYQQKPIP